MVFREIIVHFVYYTLYVNVLYGQFLNVTEGDVNV